MASSKKISFAPYLFDEYPEAALTPMEGNDPSIRKWSVFKKPYLFDNHENSERIADPHNVGPSYKPGDLPGGRVPGIRVPGGTAGSSGVGRGGSPGSLPTSNPGGGVFDPAGCNPGVLLIGGSWTTCRCDSGSCCATIVISCPEAVWTAYINPTSLTATPPSFNDEHSVERVNGQLVVTQCGLNSGEEYDLTIVLSGASPSLQYHMGKVQDQTCLGENPNASCTSCDDCSIAPIMTYTSQQMTANGTQVLGASGGAGGPYTWAVISGTGTLSASEGNAVIYTAPATNANCAGNPTIRVYDFCNNSADLKIAVNSHSNVITAYSAKVLIPGPGSCPTDCGAIWGQGYSCEGAARGADAVCRCGYCCCAYGTTCWNCINLGIGCTNYGIALCQTPNCIGTDGLTHCGGDCEMSTKVDWRTADDKTEGCCPAAFL